MPLRPYHILALALMLSLAGITAALAGPPTEAVKGTVDEVIRLLNDQALKAQKEKRFQLVKQAVDRRFDYEEMAKRTLPNWGSLSAAQRREFVSLFAELLQASYADKILRYSGEKVNYTGESLEGDTAEVRTVIMRANDRFPVNYRLLNKSQWLVYDVVMEGVSLVSNYRTQFSRILSESGYGELIKRLKTKVEEQRKLEGR
uniref:ABC transporter substrate-binding protein n=1 Tax=Desulfobacca acetoxidans TaxID=60893 RepID=A0A7V4LDN0_9BACT